LLPWVSLQVLVTEDRLPDLKTLREEFAPRQLQCPVVNVEIPPASAYDELLCKELTA